MRFMKTPLFCLLVATLAGPAFSEDGIFVAVGYGGRRMTSRDGQTWENVQQWSEKGADDSNNLMSLTYGKGKFVAVGGGGFSKETQAGHILVSTDGKDWREVAKYPFRVNPVLFDAERFVAGGPSKQLLSSVDGESWEESGKIELPPEIPSWAFWFRNGAAGNGLFVFMGNAGKDQKIWWCLTTRDGKTIENLSLSAPGQRGLAFGAGKFVALNADAIFTSPDGTSWTPVSERPEDELRGLVWTGEKFVLTGKAATYVSADGVKWKPFGKPSPGNILFAGGATFIASGWPGRMFFSGDAQNWKATGQPTPPLGVNRIVFGRPGG